MDKLKTISDAYRFMSGDARGDYLYMNHDSGEIYVWRSSIDDSPSLKFVCTADEFNAFGEKVEEWIVFSEHTNVYATTDWIKSILSFYAKKDTENTIHTKPWWKFWI